MYVISAYFISIVISLINTLYLSRILEPKEFSIFGSIISISLVIAGIFSFSQARFLTEGVSIKNLEKFSVDVVSISLIPLLILLLSLNLFGSDFLNADIEKFLFLISILIICNLFKIFFLNYERIRNNYKNFFFYYIYDKVILFFSLVVFIFTQHFELFIKIYCITNLLIFIFYLIKFKKINFNFIKDIQLMKSSVYYFFLYNLDYLISIHVLIFVMMNIQEYSISSSLALGLTIYSLMMIPLAFLETFLGPIIARIFKQKDEKLFSIFVNKNLINFNYFVFLGFFIFKLIVIQFDILEVLFPKYIDYKLIIFSVVYLTFYSFIKFYFYWFFNSMNKVEIVLRNTIYHSFVVFFLFYYFFSNLELFIFFYVLSFLIFSILLTVSFNSLKKNDSFKKVILINLFVIFDFTFFYLFNDLQFLTNILISIFIIIFYFYHKEIKIFIFGFLKKLISSNIYFIKLYKNFSYFFFGKSKFFYNLFYKLKPDERLFLNSKNRYVEDNFKGFKYIYDLSQVPCNWHFFGMNLMHDVYKNLYNDIKNSSIIFDIGSNYGFFSLESLSLNKNCKIYAFEPNLENFNHNKKNLILNNISNIKLYNFGFYSSKKILYENSTNPTNSGMINYLEEDKVTTQSKALKFVDGDSFIKSEELFEKNIGVIKIDVEGAEYHVLLGIREYLKKSKSTLHIEIDNKNLLKYNSSLNKILILLKECGYTLFSNVGEDPNHYDMICKK